MPSKKPFTFTIPDELSEKLKKVAEKKGHTASLVLCDMIRDYGKKR